mmetsp:Transcript_13665/g.20801  ORF Transcript_13665/g.20801 Transcript_13665/m.20801 type:complete len:737 (+) Transcript_13665:24-2234(+)
MSVDSERSNSYHHLNTTDWVQRCHTYQSFSRLNHQMALKTHTPKRCLLLRMMYLTSFARICMSLQLRSEIGSFLRGKRKATFIRMVELEYEYIPPNEGYIPFASDLSSSFEGDVPAGMRGEAVRSAIRSGRCICWDLNESSLQQGWLSVKGEGTLDFLNNKLSQSFAWDNRPYYREACLLNPKGRVIDKLGVFLQSKDHAHILTSPGHIGSSLFQRLDPLIFPLDQITLNDCSDNSKVITLASTKIEDVQVAINEYILPLLKMSTEFAFPEGANEFCTKISLASGASITILPTANLPPTAVTGYTIVLENDKDNLGKALWKNLVSDDSPNGPIEIGALEFETLRIESGMPGFGKELTGSDKDAKRAPAGPLELHWENSMIDMDKGCYLGQEGVTSVAKNPRGPPRLLYQVIFDYENNVFDSESEGDKGNTDNLTKLPVVGSELFVLGSQNKISVGTLTSIAEPSGTGEANVVGLVLAKRADTILKAMKDCDLEIDRNLGKEPFSDDPLWNGGTLGTASAMVQPPPMDPLDGVEVVVKDSFTVGLLRSLPSRRYPMGQNMFEDITIYEPPEEPAEGEVEVNRVEKEWTPEVSAALDQLFEKQKRIAQGETAEAKGGLESVDQVMDNTVQTEIDLATEEANQAKAAAEAAAMEAQRKEAKLEMLRKQAADAMARRQAKANKNSTPPMAEKKTVSEGTYEQSAEEIEAKRKAEKMETLRKRAEEAVARRKAKNAGSQEK